MSSPLHATCVALPFPEGYVGVLLIGAPGSGKSDLALRLIDAGARLVADDSVILDARGRRLLARAPQTIAGRMEVRGLGVVAVPFLEEVEVRLEIALGGAVPRLPDPGFSVRCGVKLMRLVLAPFEASAPAKIRLALKALTVPPHPGVTFPFALE
jgi:HPr Serine kinase C-terminal domain